MAAAGIAALALAGCGGGGSDDDDGDTAAVGATRTVDRTTTVEIVRRDPGDDTFDPAAIYEREAPGVVTVFSVLSGSSGSAGGGRGLGSGFVVNDRGEPATIVGIDPNADVALLRIDPAGLTLRPRPLGTAADLRVGSPVAAIGSPSARSTHAYLGVATTRIYPQLARRFDLPVTSGAWVQEVVRDGPADDAGLRAGTRTTRFQARTVSVGGDIIAAVDARRLEDEETLGIELLRPRPGRRVYRDGKPRNVRVTLAERPSQTDAALRRP